jgi:hypothetical protein
MERIFTGSARVPRAGDGVSPLRTFLGLRVEKPVSARTPKVRAGLAVPRDTRALPDQKRTLFHSRTLC